jgi:hypothetical protein
MFEKSIRLHGATSQATVIFVVPAARTSDIAYYIFTVHVRVNAGVTFNNIFKISKFFVEFYDEDHIRGTSIFPLLFFHICTRESNAIGKITNIKI